MCKFRSSLLRRHDRRRRRNVLVSTVRVFPEAVRADLRCFSCVACSFSLLVYAFLISFQTTTLLPQTSSLLVYRHEKNARYLTPRKEDTTSTIHHGMNVRCVLK